MFGFSASDAVIGTSFDDDDDNDDNDDDDDGLDDDVFVCFVEGCIKKASVFSWLKRKEKKNLNGKYMHCIIK